MQGVNAPGSTHYASDEEWDKARAEQLAILDRLSSIQSQKAIYGESAWDRNFQLVQSLEEILPNGKAAVAELWNKEYWNKPTERFQRIFANRPHWGIPGSLVHVDRPGVPVDLQASQTWIDAGAKRLRFEIKPLTDLERMSCLGCFVDVDCIPPRLAQDLGLITWPTSKLSGDLNVLNELKKDELLVKLKLIFDSVEWVDGDPRVGIVKEPKPEMLAFYREKLSASRPDLLPALEIPAVALGLVLYVSEKQSGRTSQARRSKKQLIEAPLKVGVYSSLYACHRGTIHSRKTYVKELGQVGDVIGRVAQFEPRLGTEWTRTASQESKEQIKEDLKELTAEVAPRLKRSQNVDKIKANQGIKAIGESLEENYRVTPRAKSSQLSAVKRNLHSRRREATKKLSFRTLDGGALDSKLREWEGSFESFARQLRGFKVHLSTRPAFGGKRWSAEEQSADKADLKRQLTLSFDQLLTMHARPFRSFVGKLVDVNKQLMSAIESSQRVGVTKALIAMDLVCRFQKLQVGLEHIKEFTIDKAGVSVDEWNKVVKILATSLPDVLTFGKNTYAVVYKDYEKLRNEVAAIRTLLTDFTSQSLTGAEREEKSAALRKRAESVDLERALQGLG